MTTAWAHLPNAELIDRVLDDLVKHPKKLNTAWDAAQDAAWRAAWDAVRDAARNTVWDAAQTTALILSRGAVLDAAQETVGDTFCTVPRGASLYLAQNVAWNAIMCLVAYDDCGFWLSPEFSLASMKVAYRLTSHPPTLLLQPYKLFLENK